MEPKAAKFIGKMKVSTQGQLTLPLEAREDLKIEVNSDVYWYSYNGFLVLSKELMNQKDIKDKIKK